MKWEFVIIGGGIAGLSSAIRLAELGEQPLLIEGGSYPCHKVCGEFLSPECIRYLENWKIHPVPISQAVISTSSNAHIFSFSSQAGGISHLQLDPALADYAIKCGVKIKTETRVVSFSPKKLATDVHQILLSNEESIEAANVIIATGRIPSYQSEAPQMKYMGFKAHFENIPSKSGTLEMFSLPGAYVGVSPIEDNKFNVAGLVKLQSDHSKDIQSLITQNPQLESYLSRGKNLFERWMITQIPEFGIKKTPDWVDAYFIGDAAVTVPPACGNGLSMGIFGGRLAAEYAIRHQAQEFKSLWSQRCSSQVFWAKLLHRVMLNPSYANSVISVANLFPYVSKKIYELTRQKKAISSF